MRRDLAILAIALLLLLPSALAANDPGHDSLYVLKIGDSNVAGSINLTGNLNATFVKISNKLFGDYLDIVANGTVLAAPSQPRIMAATSSLYLDSTGNLYLNTKGGTSGVVQVGDVATNGVTLNVSGTIRQQGVAVCLSDGTNCISGTNSGNVSSVTAGSGLTDSGTAANPVLNVGAGDGISVAADAVAVDATVCRSTGANCPAGATTESSGWLNTTNQVYLANNATNVTIGYVSSQPALFVDNTNGRIGVGTGSALSTLTVNGSGRVLGDFNVTRNLTVGQDTIISFGTVGIRRTFDGILDITNGLSPTSRGQGSLDAGVIASWYSANIYFYTDPTGSTPVFKTTSTGELRWTNSATNAWSAHQDVGIGRRTAGMLWITNGTTALGNLTLATLNATGVLVNNLNVCLSDGTNCPASGTGNVTSSVTSTDNAIVRFDGVTGKIIQNTSIIVDDSDNVNLPSGSLIDWGDVEIKRSNVNRVGATSGGSTFVTFEARDFWVNTGSNIVTAMDRNGLYLLGDANVSWASSTTSLGGYDTGIGRAGPGIVKITNATSGYGNLTAYAINASILMVGTTNVCLSDGTNCPASGVNTSWNETRADQKYLQYNVTPGQYASIYPTSALSADQTIGIKVFSLSTDASNYEGLGLAYYNGLYADQDNLITLDALTAGTGTDEIGIRLLPAGTGVLMLGGDTYIGDRTTSATPTDRMISATGGSGNDIAGASLTIAGGRATGSAAGGNLIFSTSVTGSSGSAAQTLAERMRIDQNGNIGIGTSTITQRLAINGSINVSGSGNIYYQGNLTGYGADLAELVFRKGALEPGDVVVIADGKETVERATTAYDTRVAGIVSTDPSHLMSADEGDVPLALTGRVPVKVTTVNGAIKPGDLLTTSGVPGHAMRCPDRATCSGAIVGKAMEGLPKGEGMITALVVLA